jgi:hypothetical protein
MCAGIIGTIQLILKNILPSFEKYLKVGIDPKKNTNDISAKFMS